MTDETKAQIRKLAGEGMGHRAIGRIVGVSHPTVAAVLASPAPPLELPQHMQPRVPAPPSDADDAPADDAPALEQARFLLAQARAELRRATISGDSQLAQRQTRNCAALMTVLARLEREQDTGDSITISAAEYARIDASLDERIRANCNRPLLCAQCSRSLSVFWGTGKTEAELNAGDDSNVIPVNPDK